MQTRMGDVVEVVETGGNGWWYVRRQRDGQKGFVPASFFVDGVLNAPAAAVRKQLMPNRPPPPTPLSPRGGKGQDTPPRIAGQPVRTYALLLLALPRASFVCHTDASPQRQSHEFVDNQVDQILTEFTIKARTPGSPRDGSGIAAGAASPRGSSTAGEGGVSRRQQKLNALDELLVKMDTQQPFSPPSVNNNSAAVNAAAAAAAAAATEREKERKPEKLHVIVKWPDEISGAEAYSRVRLSCLIRSL